MTSTEKAAALARADALREIETAMLAAWTGARGSPFLADAPIGAELSARAEAAIRGFRHTALFARCPTLATWGVLMPLARNYGAEDLEVYRHISAFSGESFQEIAARETLKDLYRRAARQLGLPVRGNKPTEVFFAPLGPVRAQHPDIARAFVAAAISLGPPATEDTPSARQWQRLAIERSCPQKTRLRATVAFDESAWLARRFEAWRRGEPSLGESEAHLFAAYEAAARATGRRRSDIIGPPRLVWTGTGLGFEPESGSRAQTLRFSAIPVPIAGGGRASFPAPWRERLVWSCDGRTAEIAAGPGPGEVLVFDEASGSLLGRLGATETRADFAAERHVVVARTPFAATSFGAAVPGADPSCFVAWTEPGDTLVFEAAGSLTTGASAAARPPVELVRPVGSALWIEAPVLGRSLSRPLHAADGRLHLRIDPEIGGRERVLRARVGGHTHFCPVEVGEDGTASVGLDRFGLALPGDPVRVVFEALAPKSAGDSDARAELSAAAFVWPGVTAAAGLGDRLPAPASFLPARSAGLRREGEILHVDDRADASAPIIGIETEAGPREFRLAVRGDRLWHVRVGGGQQRVPRGARIVLGHAERHDTLAVVSGDRDADLLVFGETIRRPFLGRNRFEIGAGLLERAPGSRPAGSASGPSASGAEPDDRLALRRKDGSLVVLARVIRVDDPAEVALAEIPGANSPSLSLSLSLTLRGPCDALYVRIEDAGGAVREGGEPFAGNPVAARLPAGVSANFDAATRRLTLGLVPEPRRLPALATFSVREPGGRMVPLEDADGERYALALDGTLPSPLPPPAVATLLRLARFLAEPTAASLGGQVERVLGPHYAAAFAEAGAARMVGPVRAVVELGRADGGTPRHDLVGIAPWIFEAQPPALAGLSRDCCFAPLAAMARIAAPPALPDPRGEVPLTAWLARLAEGRDLVPGLEAEDLASGFRALRYRLRDTDLRLLVAGPDAAATLLAEVHVDGLDALRAFGQAGGGDPRAGRIAALLERFARAAALGDAAGFLDRLVLRTGLPRTECGRLLTLALRAGPEIFAYFRILWHHAAASAAGKGGAPGGASSPAAGGKTGAVPAASPARTVSGRSA